MIRLLTCAVRRDESLPKHSWSFAKLGLLICNIFYITTLLMIMSYAQSLYWDKRNQCRVSESLMELNVFFSKAQKETGKYLAYISD